MTSTIEKFKQLIPSIRIKQSILNPLGSIIKIITGNLDYEDANRYERLINSLKARQSTLTKRVTIISEMSENLVKITNTTNTNFIYIDKQLWELRKLFNQTRANVTIQNAINIYNLFLHNFQLLYTHLDEIETCITFSKLRMLHQSLVNPDEMIKLLKEIETKTKLVYPVSYDNLVKIEHCIALKAYSYRSQITFILEIPLIKDKVYTYYRAIPIPVTDSHNSTKIIIPKYPYLLARGSDMVSLSQPCDELHDEKFLCHEDESQLPLEDPCITSLMKFSGNTSYCNPVLVEINSVKIVSVGKQTWILYSRAGNIFTKSCNNEITKETIMGTYLLTLDDHCDVKIGEITLKSHNFSEIKENLRKLPIISLPEIADVEPQLQRDPINLDTDDLGNLQHLNNLLKISESEVKDEDLMVIKVKSVSVATLVLYIILVLVTFIFTSYKCNLFRFFYRNHQSNSNPSDNFELEGGRVMHPISSPRVITSC